MSNIKELIESDKNSKEVVSNLTEFVGDEVEIKPNDQVKDTHGNKYVVSRKYYPGDNSVSVTNPRGASYSKGDIFIDAEDITAVKHAGGMWIPTGWNGLVLTYKS